MKICLKEDYIYLDSNGQSKLILRNCDSSCKFCPACKLKPFTNYTDLNNSFDFDKCRTLTIYGNVNCSYIETFLLKLKSINPGAKIHIIGCSYNSSQNLDIEYSHVIYPNIVSYFELRPKEFIIPAIGDQKFMLTFAKGHAEQYPGIPIVAKIFESADQEADFWLPSQIEDFMKQLYTDDDRI